MTNEQHEKAIEIKAKINACRQDLDLDSMYGRFAGIVAISKRYPETLQFLDAEVLKSKTVEAIEARVKTLEEEFTVL